MKAALLCLVVMAYLLADSTTAQGSTFEFKCGVEELKQDVISRMDIVEGKLDNVEGKLNELQVQHHDGVEELKQDVISRMDNVEGKLDNVVGKVDELQVQHHDEVEELKQDVISRMETVEGKLDNVEGKLNELQVQHNDGAEELKQDVISRMDSVEGKLDKVEGKQDTVEGKLDELQVQHQDLQGKIDRLATVVDGKLDDLKQLLEKVITSQSQPSVDGGWTQWGTWSACGSNCEHTRSRTCSNPAPCSGGSSCIGESNEKETCQGGDCSQLGKLQADSAILSSTYHSAIASNCIDGDTGNLCHTNKEKYPWLALDLGKSVTVSSVTIYNRDDGNTQGCCGNRLQDLEIRISDNLPTTLATESFKRGAKLNFFEGPGKNGEAIEMVAERPIAGRYVVLMNNSKGRHGADYLNLAEVTCMGYS